ncbi:hypothetical protein BKG68_12585 [Mycobacteroides saopaulense]|uniref:Uncharacterized protein n=1 Tax=Mycobacteroides saopaulense TaxID=1578165 RepID=A0ABX3BYF4_9MYCO|nr:hypothetical protein BKG68_12585 [Mycobacteroides saopaulense]OHU08770.1 hypothetical protein BKG73_17275 [Mycobacteroides saopaulense]
MADMDDPLDKLAPGAGQAAQTGREMDQRLLRYSGQNAAAGYRGSFEALGTEPLSKPWMAKIAEGLVPPRAFPQLPNAAGAPAIKVPWWRRLLRRFGR